MAVSLTPRPAWPRWAAGLAWALWLLILLGLAATAWLDRLLHHAGHPEDAYLVAGNLPALVAMVAAVTVGAVLASRRPRHPVGWLVLGLGYAGVVLQSPPAADKSPPTTTTDASHIPTPPPNPSTIGTHPHQQPPSTQPESITGIRSSHRPAGRHH
jgi:hypothetical protein